MNAARAPAASASSNAKTKATPTPALRVNVLTTGPAFARDAAEAPAAI